MAPPPPALASYHVAVSSPSKAGWQSYQCAVTVTLARERGGAPFATDSARFGAARAQTLVLKAEPGPYALTLRVRWQGRPSKTWLLAGELADTLAVTVPGDTTIGCP